MNSVGNIRMNKPQKYIAMSQKIPKAFELGYVNTDMRVFKSSNDFVVYNPIIGIIYPNNAQMWNVRYFFKKFIGVF